MNINPPIIPVSAPTLPSEPVPPSGSKDKESPMKVHGKGANLHEAATKIQKVFRGFRARNQLVEAYVKKNFDVITNASSLRQAKVIYTGEIHLTEEHALRIAWVINHMYKKGDRVLVEDQNRPGAWTKTKLEEDLSTQVRYVQKEIEMSGWDTKSDKLILSLRNMFILGEVLDGYDAFIKSEGKDRKLFDEIITQFKTLKMGKRKPPYGEIRANLLNNPELIDKAFKEKPKEFISYLLYLSYADSNKFINRMMDLTFTKRQRSLTGKTADELGERDKEYRKVFLIAGQSHLVKAGKVEKHLAPSLKSHKYAILIPKKGEATSLEQQKIQKLAAKRLAKQTKIQNSLEQIRLPASSAPKEASESPKDEASQPSFKKVTRPSETFQQVRQRVLSFTQETNQEVEVFSKWCKENFPSFDVL